MAFGNGSLLLAAGGLSKLKGQGRATRGRADVRNGLLAVVAYFTKSLLVVTLHYMHSSQ